MKTYIALLRGINVSGHKLIKMEMLRKVLAELDFGNIRTYIQSGNILFESSQADTAALENRISAKILEHFGFEVPVVILTLGQLEGIVADIPFTPDQIPDATQPYVALLSAEPLGENQAVLRGLDFTPDKLHIGTKAVYLIYENAGRTKLTNAVIEGKLKVRATSRNWKTILKLVEMAGENSRLKV